jgi:adenylate kinase family enzyme
MYVCVCVCVCVFMCVSQCVCVVLGIVRCPQSHSLARDLSCTHTHKRDYAMSLRRLRAAVSAGTRVGLLAKEAMDSGALVTDEIVFGIIEERITQSDCTVSNLLIVLMLMM